MTRTPFHHRKAFTLTELLVVIGIIVLLVGLVLTMSIRGRAAANRARVQADLQAIATALEAYKQDFGDYPRIPEAETMPAETPANLGSSAYMTGAELLCWALIGPYDQTGSGGFNPSDGASGPGFRNRTGGRGLVYGPYLSLDSFKFGVHPQISRYKVLTDYHEEPILYFAARNPRPAISSSYAGRGKGYLYDFRENGAAFYRSPTLADSADALNRFSVVLGDVVDDTTGVYPPDGKITGTEQPATQGPYLLWAPGADTRFGPDNPAVVNEVKECDDILVPAN